MTITILSSLAIFIVLILVIRWIMNSEKVSERTERQLLIYGASNEFVAFYKKHALKSPEEVVQRFEREYPELVKELEKRHKDQLQHLAVDHHTYDQLIFKYQDVLLNLRATGEQWFTEQDLLTFMSQAQLNELVAAHIIERYTDKYMIKKEYLARHPEKKDALGQPKIRKI